jgi:hypothetical protein
MQAIDYQAVELFMAAPAVMTTTTMMLATPAVMTFLVVSIPVVTMMIVPIVVMSTMPVVIFVFIVKPDSVVPPRPDPNHLGFFIVVIPGFDVNADSDIGYFW